MVPKSFLRGLLQFYVTNGATVLRDALTLLEADKETNQNFLNTTRYAVAMIERNYPAAEQALVPISPELFSNSKTLSQAMIQLARHEASELIAATLAPDFSATRKNIERDADNADNHSNLGFILALAGKKGDAVREGLRGVELAKPGFPQDLASANLALIYAQTDKENEAVVLLENLVTRPGLADVHPDSIVSITLADLRLRPQWDPLRNNERFKKLVAGPVN
jgi:hypothetical protein